jgi:hypothetical protein
MFESLPTSQTMSARWTHAALVALLSHGLVIAAAVASTASPPAATRPISRDTIRLEIADVAEVSHSYTEEFIPAPPRVPDIRMNAPEFQAPRLNFSLPGHAETSRTLSTRALDDPRFRRTPCRRSSVLPKWTKLRH